MVIAFLVSAVLAAPTDAEVRAVAALSGEPSTVAAAGLTKEDAPILTIENGTAFDPASTKKRVVVFGTSDATAAAVLDVVRWYKTDAVAAALRAQCDLSALPLAAFDPADAKGAAITRWMSFQAPDAIVEVDEADAHPIGPGDVLVSNWVSRLPVATATLGSTLLTACQTPARGVGVGRSPHDVMRARVSRDPLTIAMVLAKKYPEQPSISYIPSVAWTNTLKLATLTSDESLTRKVREQTAPVGRPALSRCLAIASN